MMIKTINQLEAYVLVHASNTFCQNYISLFECCLSDCYGDRLFTQWEGMSVSIKPVALKSSSLQKSKRAFLLL